MAPATGWNVTTQVAYVEDIVLVDRCLDGQEAAARDLFRRHRARVHASLYRILGSNRDMDDLLQEVFVQVFASLRSWRAEASLATWIDRIAVRVAWRSIARRRARPPEDELGDLDAPGADVGGARAVQAREGVRRLYAALATLSPPARVAFALHEIDGRPLAEVATVTGASLTATKLRVWRARRALHALAAADPVLRDFLDDAAGGDR
ncbi:MAG: RNA polymerase sigma factor [Myxococcales bacterium]|nr:RNA polymerase sigma factor [Myxococcales bacterium]